jgi:hypothetical protein
MRLKATKAAVHASIAAVVSWQHKVWASGHFPTRGFYNEVLSGHRAHLAGQKMQYTAAFLGIRADSKARAEVHNCHRWYQTSFCCDLCLASQPFKHADRRLTYLDLRRNAPYAATVLTHEEYINFEKRQSPWRQVPGWRLECCYYDVLHVIHLGVSKQSNASCIIELLEGGSLPGDNAAQQLMGLTHAFADWCKQRRLSACKFPFTLAALNRTKRTDYPELASYFKGSHVKLLSFYMAERARGHVLRTMPPPCHHPAPWPPLACPTAGVQGTLCPCRCTVRT